VQSNPLIVLYRVVLLALLVVLVGVLGYRLTAGLEWLDALYMTIITLSTVGFREVGPLDDSGKVFTICLIMGGAGVIAYAVKTAVEIVLDESTHQFFRHRTTLKKVANMKDHYIVCGYGRVGRSVCEELANEKQDFVLVDHDPQVIQDAAERGFTALHADATEEQTLSQAGIEQAKGLMCCVKSDSDNLMLIMTARGMVDGLKISARVSDERNLKKFRRAGADNIYSPFSLVGRRIARSLTRPRVMELIDLALEETHYDLTIAEYPVPPGSDLLGKNLIDSEFRSRYGLVILSLIRQDRSILHNPPATTVFESGDHLVVLGTQAQMQQLTGKQTTRSQASV
jgi:voltage-gated potassium channel